MISNFKFRLTNWTLDQYSSLSDVLQSQKNCLKLRCLREFADQKPGEGGVSTDKYLSDFTNCVQNCETGAQEVMKMQ